MRYRWLPRHELTSIPPADWCRRFPEPLAEVLSRRGLTEEFLSESYRLISHWGDIPGALEAAGIIADAVRSGTGILVHGDFDADGISATATALRVLKALGANVDSHIPCRFEEGYGLGDEGVEKCLSLGAGLMITADCGITSVSHVASLRDMGVLVVVTDHHMPGTALPMANAIVDPAASSAAGEPWENLSGAGVLHGVLRGVCELQGAGEIPELRPELVAIGTVCDMVDLTGDNRLLVKEGLEIMAGASISAGLEALLRVSGVEPGAITASDIGFKLGPRINSAGRIAHSDTALRLLLATDRDEAVRLAGELDSFNSRRRELDTVVYSEAMQSLRDDDSPVAVAGSGNWHQGVIGISASRLARELGKPVVLVAWQGENGRGSARGLPGKPVHALLAQSYEKGLLERFGGHDQAAGLSISRGMFNEFKSFLRESAGSMGLSALEPVLHIDGGLRPEDCTMELLRAVGEMEPFGQGNPEPVWITRGVYPASYRTVGAQGRHLQLEFQHNGKTLRAIGFDMGERTSELNRPLDIAHTLAADTWRGGDSIQLIIRDMRPSNGVKR